MDIAKLAAAISYALLLIAALVVGQRRVRSSEMKRRRKFLPPRALAASKGSTVFAWIMILAVILAVAYWASDLATDMSRDELTKAGATSLGIIIWLGVLMASPFSPLRILRRWAPDAELIGALATAFGRIIDASEARWRKDLSERHAVALELGNAAGLMEARHRRALAFVTPALDAPSWLLAEEPALRLRGLAAKVVLCGEEQRELLAAWVGSALAAAVARRPDCFPKVGLGLAQAPSTPIRRGSRVWRFIVAALVPAAIVIAFMMVGASQRWTFVTENQSLFIQIAVVLFGVGSTKAFDPSGYDKSIGTITETGGALFGWGKKKG
jgi:hypothetical protein